MARSHGCILRLGVLLLASSCSPGGERPSPGAPAGQRTGAAASPLALYPASPEGHGALLRGRLELEGPCLYIVREGGERWLAAFPSPGTDWNPGDRAVRVGDRVLRVGATGGFGGGEVKNGAGALSWVRAPDASCDSAKVWLVTGLAEP
ncbi:MAG TPA: hypothetical protein VF746_01365 [Longimicrobium sp.]|jgi:hypothetical protein